MILLFHETPSELHAQRGPFLTMIEAMIIVTAHIRNMTTASTPKMVAEKEICSLFIYFSHIGRYELLRIINTK
jgi:hypothetical protein